jgi:hypothetical protein
MSARDEKEGNSFILNAFSVSAGTARGRPRQGGWE